MLAFSDQCMYSSDFVEKLEAFVLYTTLFYLPWWTRSGFATKGPKNDIDVIRTNAHISLFVDNENLNEIADAVHQKSQAHTRYLTDELVVLSLFSEAVSNDDKHQIAEKLLSFSWPSEFVPGKPQLPFVNPDAALADFVGPNSWLLFRLFDDQNDWSWLMSDPK